ncbi:MAG: beta-N-acetylhexosaminidase [Magnetovibrio sp.]|nr:beta-N-acetylhexosaminidase [Magnetovibrio sp.]
MCVQAVKLSISPPLAVIFGCSGTVLSDEEWRFFSEVNPFGFILFQRNCNKPEQVKALVSSLRIAVQRPNAPVLIDQEGGRVQRLKPPYWREIPAASCFAELYNKDQRNALKAARLNSFLIAHELLELGIDVNCAPVLDLPQPEADLIIGDRAYGNDVNKISALAMATCEGFLEGGVLPVIKHIPGHGRANVDSHKALPLVDVNLDSLITSDFVPFKNLNFMPWAMTAHVLYQQIDRDYPATLSKKVIQLIRNHIGFEGLLLSDDLSMEALDGSLKHRTVGALAAGCDVVLHCNGQMDEMVQVVSGGLPLSDQAKKRVENAENFRIQSRVSLDGTFDYYVQKLEAMLT